MKSIIQNKKMMVVMVAALALVIGVFGVVTNNTVSDAANNSRQGGATVGGVHFEASCDDGTPVVVSASGQSSNTPAGANVIGSVSVKGQTKSIEGKHGTVSMSASDPSAFANVAYTVYIIHEDGTPDSVEGTFDSLGRASFGTNFSNFTLVATPNGDGTGTDTSSTSPQTGDLS